MQIVSPHTAGNPMNDEKWLNCRLRDLQIKLTSNMHFVSLPVISRLLRHNGYDLHTNSKQNEGSCPEKRDDQFVYLQKKRKEFMDAIQPVLSIDCKKKELVGDFKNPGYIWCEKPERVNVHDFPSQGVGKAVPYGLYDVKNNIGTVYVGQSADTAEFAVDNLVHWWQYERPDCFASSTSLLLHADCGGSNSVRCRLWKQQLQEKLADQFGIEVTVCHYPTGCSKWNPIEHRLFSQISKTWAGCPLRSFEIILHYLRQTRTETGLRVAAHLVSHLYEKGLKVADDIMASLKITYHDICPQWNYTIYPRVNVNPI